MLALRLLMLCDVYLFCFDMTQFYASTAHAYGSMLLALCFPAESGRLAGVQLGLLLQWFFSGLRISGFSRRGKEGASLWTGCGFD